MGKDLSTTVAVYTDQRLAEQDWDAMETGVQVRRWDRPGGRRPHQAEP